MKKILKILFLTAFVLLTAGCAFDFFSIKFKKLFYG